MNRRKFLGTITLVSIAWMTGCTNPTSTDSQTSVSKDSGEHQDPDGYWTCSMHPQVHQHEPGKCPICGMALIKVKANQQKVEKKTVETKDEGLEVNSDQLKNSRIGKFTVARKDLEILLPASGRLLSSREVVFQIFESEIFMVKPGQEFRGSPSSIAGRLFQGQISRVDTLVDPTSRTVRATGLLNESIPSAPGESGFHGEIIQKLKNQIIVPEESVLHTGSRSLVYVFSSDQKLSAREVQLGAKGKNEYQILSGLQEGEVISLNSNFLIDSEAKIRGQ